MRLCTWNIQLGLQLETIVNAIKTLSHFRALDLLALQEASIHSDEEDARRIAAALGPNYESYQVTAHVLGKYAQANALVWNTSRVCVVNKNTITLPRVRETNLSRAERTFLCALPQQARMCIVLDGTFADESLRVYVAHLDVLGMTHKREQFNRILSDAKTRQPSVGVALIAGDLNTFHIRSRPS